MIHTQDASPSRTPFFLLSRHLPLLQDAARCLPSLFRRAPPQSHLKLRLVLSIKNYLYEIEKLSLFKYLIMLLFLVLLYYYYYYYYYYHHYYYFIVVFYKNNNYYIIIIITIIIQKFYILFSLVAYKQESLYKLIYMLADKFFSTATYVV